MTIYKKWDLILVSFPFTDFTSQKRRPALIVSPDNFNAGKDVTIVYITSQMQTPVRIGDYQIKSWMEAGLPKPSMVRMKFATIDKSIVIKKLGRLEGGDRAEIERIIVAFFGS